MKNNLIFLKIRKKNFGNFSKKKNFNKIKNLHIIKNASYLI